MAKVKGKHGFRFIKEVGGAIRRETVSKTALYLEEHGLLRGRVLDYGCGFGLDADQFGWEAFDPKYRQKLPEGQFDTRGGPHSLDKKPVFLHYSHAGLPNPQHVIALAPPRPLRYRHPAG